MSRILFVILGISIIACSKPKEAADTILHNGNVYSLNWSEPDQEGKPAPDAPFIDNKWHPDATAIAIKGNMIIKVGTDDEILKLADDRTQLIDVNGKFVYPGFVDSHTHPFGLGEQLEQVDLKGAETEEEAVERIVQRAKQVPKGNWIIGAGFDEGAWANRMPDKKMLSERLPDHPVFMNGLHGFAAWVNEEALSKASITKDTEDPIGGTIGRYADGAPNGQFYNNATDLITAAIPAKSLEQMKSAVVLGLEELAKSGYTSNHHAGVSLSQLEALNQLEKENQLLIRLYGMLRLTDTALIHEWLARGPKTEHDDMLRIRSVKAFYDGSLGVRGARLLADYADQAGHQGVSGAAYGFDQQLAASMMSKGFQIGIHAIGDAANREVLDFFKQVYEIHPAARSNRNRIEHAQVIHPDDFQRFNKLDIIASMEPPHMAEDKLWAEDRLGAERIKGAYAWRSLRRNNVRLTFNSDLPGSDHNIFYGLYAAITRKDKAHQPEGGWYTEESLRAEEALRAYTSWSAYAAFWEKEKGVLAEGKWADITVVDVDVLNEGEKLSQSLLNGKVLMTFVNGEMIYSNR